MNPHIYTIGLDIDGCLANFNVAYAKILTELSGIKFPNFASEEPKTWQWDRAAGITAEQEREAWLKVRNSNTFWCDLPAYPDAHWFLTRLSDTDHEVYFVTNRTGFRCKEQTEVWLAWNGWRRKRTDVIISKYKGHAAKALDCDIYLDDKLENIYDVVDIADVTEGYLLKKPYNFEETRLYKGEFFKVDNLRDFAKQAELF